MTIFNNSASYFNKISCLYLKDLNFNDNADPRVRYSLLYIEIGCELHPFCGIVIFEDPM
jgi:hypothetical protein